MCGNLGFHSGSTLTTFIMGNAKVDFRVKN